MKSRLLLIAALVSLSSLGHAGDTGSSVVELQGMERLDILRVAPCKANGDGTYTEIVTTMASVMPPEEARAFLERYCDECNRRKFAQAEGRAQ